MSQFRIESMICCIMAFSRKYFADRKREKKEEKKNENVHRFSVIR